MRPRRHRARLPGPSTSPLAVMLGRVLASLSLVAVASCAPTRNFYYQAVDRPCVAPIANSKVFENHPTRLYELGTWRASWIAVHARYQEGRARVLLTVVVWPGHHVAFRKLNIRLTALADSTVNAVVPVTFYMECGYGGDEPDRYCDHVPAAMQTLDGPRSSSQSVAAFAGVAEVPPEFVDGFLVALSDVSDGTSRIESGPLRFEHRPEPWKGSGTCH